MLLLMLRVLLLTLLLLLLLLLLIRVLLLLLMLMLLPLILILLLLLVVVVWMLRTVMVETTQDPPSTPPRTHNPCLYPSPTHNHCPCLSLLANGRGELSLALCTLPQQLLPPLPLLLPPLRYRRWSLVVWLQRQCHHRAMGMKKKTKKRRRMLMVVVVVGVVVRRGQRGGQWQRQGESVCEVLPYHTLAHSLDLRPCTHIIYSNILVVYDRPCNHIMHV